jgi:hypothetical protein
VSAAYIYPTLSDFGLASIEADSPRVDGVSTALEAHSEGMPVYNLTVDGGHTYFVTDDPGDIEPVWVHNGCNPLRTNLIEAGILPQRGEAAHHIVAKIAEAAEEAKNILNFHGIDIHEPINGVFLPRNASIANPFGKALHESLHTERNYREIRTCFKTASA